MLAIITTASAGASGLIVLAQEPVMHGHDAKHSLSWAAVA